MKWADETVLSALQKVPAEKISADLGNSFRSMLDTVNHVFLAEQVWFKRAQGENVRLAELPVPADLNALSEAWPQLHRAWLDWARDFSGWSEPFRKDAGPEWNTPFWQVVLHVVNHGSYHRGQLATLMRQSGIQPSATDLILFYRIFG